MPESRGMREFIGGGDFAPHPETAAGANPCMAPTI